MYFSIVTVVLNDLENLKTTIASVHEQTFNDYEHIIMDGMSEDGTQQFIECILKDYPKIKYYRKSDEGLYYAMNNAVEVANGEYVNFLNAGDVFFDENTLKSVYDENCGGADIFYGYSLFSSGKRKGQKAGQKISPLLFRRGGVVAHQAVFEKTRLLREYPFDTSLRIQADQEQIVHWLKNRAEFYYTDRPLCYNDGLGLTSRRKSEVISLHERVEILRRYYKICYLLFRFLTFLKIKLQYRDVNG